jgi:hypothetical protein
MKNFNPLDIGWFLHGTSGGVAAGAFFALPGSSDPVGAELALRGGRKSCLDRSDFQLPPFPQ